MRMFQAIVAAFILLLWTSLASAVPSLAIEAGRKTCSQLGEAPCIPNDVRFKIEIRSSVSFYRMADANGDQSVKTFPQSKKSVESPCDAGYNPCLSGGCCLADHPHTCAAITTCHTTIEDAVTAGCNRKDVDVCYAPAK